MKCFFLRSVVLILILCTQNLSAQDSNGTVAGIRQTFAEINSYTNYRIVTIDESEQFLGHATDNGGSLKGYYKGDTLRKIIEWVGLSNRVVQNEYYFGNGQLLFVYSTDKQYRFDDKRGQFDYTSFSAISAARFYFNNGRLIESVFSNKEEEAAKAQTAARLFSSSTSYARLLGEKGQ